MAFKELQSLDAENTIALGGYNKKTKKENPTKAEGYYLGSRSVASKMSTTGESLIHFLQTPEGNLGVWGKTDLDRKIKQVPAGAMVRITQSGTKPSNKGNDMYVFKVEVDNDNTISVDLQESSEPAGDEPYENYEEDVELSDEVQSTRSSRPTQAASTPDAARQAKVKELLAKGRSKST